MNKNTNDIVIYCDGFLTNESFGIINKSGGCSIALEVNDKVVWNGSYSFQLSEFTFFKKLVNKKLTVPNMEFFAMYRALQLANGMEQFCLANKILDTANKQKQNIFIYSDSMNTVKQVTGEWRSNNFTLLIWYKKCIKLKKDNHKPIWIKRDKIVEILGH